MNIKLWKETEYREIDNSKDLMIIDKVTDRSYEYTHKDYDLISISLLGETSYSIETDNVSYELPNKNYKIMQPFNPETKETEK